MFHVKVGEREFALNILDALGAKEPRTFHVTVPNGRQVDNLRRELCLECPVEFSRRGASARHLGDVPEGVRACIEKAFLTTELIVDAALERSRAKFVQAIVVDGWIPSIRAANELADELLAVHRPYLAGW
jgi:alpha-galactosidase/6-phospho-beta-glucosidase family protein